MRIVIDLQGAQGESRFRGLGRFSLWFAKALVENNTEHDIHLALNGHFQDSIDDIRHQFESLLPQTNIHVWYSLANTAYILDNHGKREISEEIYKGFIKSLNPDVLIIASFFEGYSDASVFSIDEKRDYQTFVVLYDIIPHLFQDIYFENKTYEKFYKKQLENFKKNDFFLSISQASLDDAEKYLELKDSIFNIGCAIIGDFSKKKIKNEKSILKKFGIEKPFLLSTMANDPRKNFEGLLEAFLSSTISLDHQLVLVTHLEENQKTILKNLLDKYKHVPESIIITNYINDEMLVGLYNLCKASIFPSHYEGFGLPALEAMACGKAVICSNNSSLPEIVNNEDALFDSKDIESMRLKIEQVLNDDNFRKSLEEKGYERSKDFSWDLVAKKTLDFIDKKLCKKNIDDAKKRKKLAYVSPFPPSKTGIADYSFELINSLKNHYDIDIIIKEDDEISHDLKKEFQIHYLNWLKDNSHQYDRVLYHIGNSPFHIHMFEMIKQIPGVIVLHDFFLSNILYYMECELRKENHLVKSLYQNHGYSSLFDSKKLTIEETVLKYPCSHFVFENALGVILHSEYAKILSKYWFNGRIENYSIPHLRALKNVCEEKYTIKNFLNIKHESFIVSSFGNIHPVKNNEKIINSFIKSKLKNNKNCYLILVGDYGGPYGEKLKLLIKNSQLQDRIILTGWADHKTFEDYLKITDISVQLRQMSRGETSGTVLDCMKYKIPTIINANGSMAEFPDDVVYILEDEFKEEDLICALEKLYDDQKFREDLGKKGREYIEKERSPDLCAKLYHEQIEEFYSKNHPLKIIDEVCFNLKDKNIRTEILSDISCSVVQSFKREKSIKTIFVDISVLVRQDLKTGIERVTRAILLELLKRDVQGYRIEPVYAKNNESYRYARSFISSLIGVSLTDMEDEFIDINPGDIFFGLDWAVNETLQNKNQLLKWKNEGIRMITFLYDILPILKPNFFPDNMGYFSDWLETISEVSDQIICISQAVEDDLKNWILENNIERRRPLEITHINLGSDVENSLPTTGIPENAHPIFNQLKYNINFLMVGTVEPRKGHRQTLKAFDDLWGEGLDVNLVIVGKQGWKMEDFIDLLNTHPERNKRLFWLSGISDEFLEKIYSHSTCLIAASEGEGYGLPIVEAAKHSLPIIARDIPVFREVSQNHAFFFDGLDSLDLSSKMREWIDLYKNNQNPLSKDIKLITWKESADQVLDIMLGGDESSKKSQIIRFDQKDDDSPFTGEIDFSKSKIKNLQKVEGLSNNEEWGRWSDANLHESIVLNFKKQLPNQFNLTITGITFGDNAGSDMPIKINDKTYILRLEYEIEKTIFVDLDDDIGYSIEFFPPRPQYPGNGDMRKIAVGLKRIKIKEVKD